MRNRFFCGLLGLVLLLSACGTTFNLEPNQKQTVSATSVEDAWPESLEETAIPVTAENRTKDITLQYIAIRSAYDAYSANLMNALHPGAVLEKSWIPQSEYSDIIWIGFEGGLANARIEFELEACEKIDVLLEQTDALRLMLTVSYQHTEPITHQLRYNSSQNLWHPEEPEAVLYGVYISPETAHEINPDFPENITYQQNRIMFFTYEPITEVRFWSRRMSSSDINPPYGSWELQLEEEFDGLDPGGAVAMVIYEKNYVASFVSYLDANGIEQVDRIHLYYQYGTPEWDTPAGYTSPLSAEEWEKARETPPLYEKEHSLYLVNHTAQTLEGVCAQIGDEEFPLLEKLLPGEGAQVEWKYTGPAFLWDSDKWAPAFTARKNGQKITIDQLQLYTDDVRDEFEFTTAQIAFFESPTGDVFCSPQEDYLERSTNDGEYISLATYQYLPQVRRWIQRMTPGQMLFGVGLEYDGGREYRYLFPESQAQYPAFGSICVMIATGDIYLHDVKMEYDESGAYLWVEHTVSEKVTIYTAKDAALFGLDHVRGPYRYYRYRGADGSIVRQAVSDQMRDGNNGSVNNMLLLDVEYYELEDIQ